MARDVATTLKKLVAIKLNLNEEQVEDYFFQLKVWELGWDAPEGSDQGHMPVEPGPEQQTLGAGEGECPETLCTTAETWGCLVSWSLVFPCHSSCQLAERSGQCVPFLYP